MDKVTIELLVLLGTIVGLFVWNRSESRSDMRMAREDTRMMLALINSIKEEIKDFHGRLCALEERKKMEKE